MTGFGTQDTFVVMCMVIGLALGEWMNIEHRLELFGEWCRSKIPAGHVSATFVEAFVSSSLLSCVGSILIFALGLNLVLGSKIKIGNMLLIARYTGKPPAGGEVTYIAVKRG